MEGKLNYSYNQFHRNEEIDKKNRIIYWGEVISIDDPSDGGRIKVRIPGFDNKILNDNLPYCYPLIPKFIHLYPKIGEIVRIFIEDPKYPQRSRFWVGSVISQPQKISFDGINTALSTTNIGLSQPLPSPRTIPESDGIYPKKDEVAILGRLNNDIILRDNEVEIRAGKHQYNNNLKLNKLNPASIRFVFEKDNLTKNEYRSSTVVLSDKIALITHKGNPKFKSFNLNNSDRDRIFTEGEPLAKGRSLINVLKLIRSAILGHVHPYPKLQPDLNDVIRELEKINFDTILNPNIVTN